MESIGEKMETQTRNNLKNKTTWMRLLHMVLYAIAFNIAEVLIAIITLVQFFTVLFAKTPNLRLQTFGGELGEYIRDIVDFLTYRTDHMPYPASDWGNKREPEPKPNRNVKLRRRRLYARNPIENKAQIRPSVNGLPVTLHNRKRRSIGLPMERRLVLISEC
jgi:hypothetical protein